MSEQPAVADLFARKGTAGAGGGSDRLAKPAALDVLAADGGDVARDDEATARGGRGAGEAAAPASLRSIDLRRGNALAAALADRDGAALASVGAEQTPGDHGLDDAPAAAQAAESPSAASAHGPFLALLAIACFAAGFWYTLSYSNRAEPEDDATVQAEGPALPAISSGPGGESTPVPVEPEAPADRQAAQPAGHQQADTPPPSEAAGEPGRPPSFDLIRIEPNGEAVIAGRAAPNSQMILLDNGQPIGKVTADWAGEWAFIPATPLAPGDHEFSLVIVTPQGTVAVPGVGKPEKGSFLQPIEPGGSPVIKAKAVTGRIGEQPAPDVPAPSGGATGKIPSYAVQLSSTTSWKGAEQEWLKLQRSFPQLLGDKTLVVHKAELDDRGTWYRVRTGDFAELSSARKLCSALRAKRQECLVIKR